MKKKKPTPNYVGMGVFLSAEAYTARVTLLLRMHLVHT